jgi:hypothetical protein
MPCTDTFGRKALAFLAVEHFQRVKKHNYTRRQIVTSRAVVRID